MRAAVVAGTALVALSAIVAVLMMTGRDAPRELQPIGSVSPADSEVRRKATARPDATEPNRRNVPDAPKQQDVEASSDGDATSDGAPLAEEAGRTAEAEEEMLVNAFDDLTDMWREPSAKSVSMADIENFAKSFREIPRARRNECIHRALNLIPDANVMLLAGVLMDKTMDRETVETVYNDILNRDEDVKKPILWEIFKDKTHPCWADTAWILDVTGELPKRK